MRFMNLSPITRRMRGSGHGTDAAERDAQFLVYVESHTDR
jgi:hypothetical protein